MDILKRARAMRPAWKRLCSSVLALALVVGVIGVAGLVPSRAELLVRNTGAGEVYFYAPETIYLRPGPNTETSQPAQYFVNNWTTAPGNDVGPNGYGNLSSLPQLNNATSGWIHFHSPNGVDGRPVSNVRITVHNTGGTGINPALSWTLPTSGNVTLNSGNISAQRSGLVIWKVVFTKDGADFISYCYTYIYRPDMYAISGALGFGGADVRSAGWGSTNCDLGVELGVYFIGSHYETVNNVLRPNQGTASANNNYAARYPSQLMIQQIWGATNTNFTGTAYSTVYSGSLSSPDRTGGRIGTGGGQLSPGSGMNYYGTAAAGVPNSIAWGGDDSGSANYTLSSVTGGRGYIQVDSSRYANLNAIPQLEWKAAVNYFEFFSTHQKVTWRSENSASWSHRSGTDGITGDSWTNRTGLSSIYQNPAGTASVVLANARPPLNSNYGGSGVTKIPAGTIGYLQTGRPQRADLKTNTGIQNLPQVYSVYVRKCYAVDDHDTFPTLRDAAVRRMEITTQLEFTTRDKANLRAQLVEELRNPVQPGTVNNYDDYIAKLNMLAEMVCRPDYPFGTTPATAATTLDTAANPASMAGLVKTARALCTRMGPAMATASYRSIETGRTIYFDNSVSYWLGEHVYARYDATLNFAGHGYRPIPVAVSVPGSIPPNPGSGYLGGTLSTYTPGDPRLITGAGLTALDVDGGQGCAANDPLNPINMSTALQSGLTWIWWMEPIQYRIVYLPGDHGIPRPYDKNTAPFNAPPFYKDVKYDTVGTLDPCMYSPAPGYAFDGWFFQSRDCDPGFEFENLTTVDGYEIYATAKWKPLEPEALQLQIDPNGGSLGSHPGFIWGNTQMKYSALSQEMTDLGLQAYREGYTFVRWSFSISDPNTTNPADISMWWSQNLNETMNADHPGLRVYAIWRPRTTFVNYDRNFATGGFGTNPSRETVVFDQESIPLNDGQLIGLHGYTQIGWFIDQLEPCVDPMSQIPASKTQYFFNKGGTYRYSDLFGPQFVDPPGITLYAVWQANDYTVVFHENWHDKEAYEAMGWTPPYPATPLTTDIFAVQQKVYGYEYGLSYSAASPTLLTPEWPGDPPDRYGWTFAGWSTEPTRITTSSTVDKDSLFRPTSTQLEAIKPGNGGDNQFHLYARWVHGSQMPFDVVLHLDGGRIEGYVGEKITIRAQPQGQNLMLDPDYTPKRTGYRFVGWDFDPAYPSTSTLGIDGAGRNYVFVNDETWLVAIWEPLYYRVTFHANYPDGTDDIEVTINLNFADLLNPPTVDVPALGRFVCTGKSLLGYNFESAGTPGGLGTSLVYTRNAGTSFLLSRLITDSGSDATSLDLYGIWTVNGGVPTDPPGWGDDDDIPDKPQDPPPGFDPDGGDGWIVMYITAPRDVEVYPTRPDRIFLTREKTYGASTLENGTIWPEAARTDGIFVGWRVIKYGSAGTKEFGNGDGLLGKIITDDLVVDHDYSIWVAPIFKPGYAIKYMGNGGTIVGTGGLTEIRRVVFPGETYGGTTGNRMPSAERDKHDFLGWFTLPDGGVQVFPATVVGPNGTPVLQGTLVPEQLLPVADTLFAQWNKNTSWFDDVVDDVKGWLSSDSLMHLPNWASLTLLGIGLPMLGITTGTFASLSTGIIFLACLLGLLFFPLALMLPFLFPVIGALMPIWWPLMIIL